MKRTLVLCMILLMILPLFSSCSFEAYVPENEDTINLFAENMEIFEMAVNEAQNFEFDCLISNTSYYIPQEANELVGLYVMNMDEHEAHAITNTVFSTLMNQCGVKMIDVIHRGDLTICCFGFSTPNHDFDYGYYYSTGNAPVYLGDPDQKLDQDGNGFSFKKSASFGSSITYYTEQISDSFYYYEIS